MRQLIGIVAFLVLSVSLGVAQEEQDLRLGKNYLDTKVYSAEEDRRILDLFEGLRVADVSDGMDRAGLADVGLMDPSIHPLWKDTKEFTHRIIGIAVTVRYVPSNERHPSYEEKTAAFDAWVGKTYSQITPEPFTSLIREGTVLVIEEAPLTDVGTIGSNNIMSWVSKGCVGVVTSQTARDTDEIIAEGVPLYYKKPGRGIRPGRNMVESVNRPVVCGGATVMPGDVIVADGDGVIVVPRQYAEEVAIYAQQTIEKDKQGRRALYKRLGLPEDASVK